MKKCPYHKKMLEDMVASEGFPCVMGQSIVKGGKYDFNLYDSMDLPETAAKICHGIYSFLSEFKNVQYASYLAIFPEEQHHDDNSASLQLTKLLYNMHLADKNNGFTWATNVSSDPKSKFFSYSVGGVGFFVPFMHPKAAYKTRKSHRPCLIFNPHDMFEQLRKDGKYSGLRDTIRGNEKQILGEVPALLADFGQDLEYPQYFLPKPEGLDTLVWDPLQAVGGKNPFG